MKERKNRVISRLSTESKHLCHFYHTEIGTISTSEMFLMEDRKFNQRVIFVEMKCHL